MATSSRLKTVDGKYYATEEYVKKYVDENLNEEILSGDIGEAISGAVLSQVNPLQAEITEVHETINNLFTMNTL